MTQYRIRGEGLHHGGLEQLEQTHRTGVGVGDLAAHEECIGAPVTGREGDQSVTVEDAVILGADLADATLGSAETVRMPSRHDDDGMRREGSPRSLPDPEAPGPAQHVVNGDRLERTETQAPSALYGADGERAQPHRERDEKAVEKVGSHDGGLCIIPIESPSDLPRHRYPYARTARA